MSANQRNNPIFTQEMKYAVRGDTGAIVQEIDKLQSSRGYNTINTAMSSDTTLLATVLSGKRYIVRHLSINNLEAFAVTVTFYDGTGNIVNQYVVPAAGATSNLTITSDFGIMQFSTSILYQVTGGTFAAGTRVALYGSWCNT